MGASNFCGNKNSCRACFEKPLHECRQNVCCYLCGKQIHTEDEKRHYAEHFTCFECADRPVSNFKFLEYKDL